MAYGLYQGLNEAYSSYRDREREIEAEDDRETNRKALATERERQGVRFEREGETFADQQEQIDYNKGRRKGVEKLQDIAGETAERQNEMGKIDYDVYMGDEAVKQRAETNRLNLANLKQSKQISDLQLDDAKMANTAKKGAVKYREWKNKFMENGDIDELVKSFNTDDDKFNNIKKDGVTGSEEDGWTVEFENGETKTFEDRNAVGIHLESMADPSFHQQYLLQMEAQKASIAAAIKKANAKTPDTLAAQKKTWEAATFKITDRLKGSIIKEGVVDFGTEGNKEIAALLGSIIDQVGKKGNYDLVQKEVGVSVNQLLKASTDLEPANVRKRAEDLYESIPADRIPGGKLDKGDDGYEDALKALMKRDVVGQIQRLERDVFSSYFQMDKDKNITMRDRSNYGLNAGASTSDSKGSLLPVPTQGQVGVKRQTAGEAAATEEAGATSITAEIAAEKRKDGSKMPVSEFVSTVIQGMGNKGSAFKDAPIPEPNKLSQKNIRRIKTTAEGMYEKQFKGLTPAQKRGWLDSYGKWLSKKTLSKARLALKKEISGY